MNGSFTNRHGKKTNVDGVVDEILASEKSAPHIPKASKQKGTRLSVYFPKKSKKLGLALVAVLLFLLFGYLVLADTARREFDLVAAENMSKIESIRAQSISDDTSGAEALKGLNEKLGVNKPCQSYVPNVIYSFYPPAASSLNACNTSNDAYAQLVAAIGSAYGQAQYLAEQKTALAPALAQPADGAYAEIPGYANAWETSVASLEKIDPPVSMQATHTKLVINSKAVLSGWLKLAAANNEQNPESFTAAETGLAKAYESLRVSGEEMDAVVATQQKAIESAASKF